MLFWKYRFSDENLSVTAATFLEMKQSVMEERTTVSVDIDCNISCPSKRRDCGKGAPSFSRLEHITLGANDQVEVENQTRRVHLIQLLMHSSLYLLVKHQEKCQFVYQLPVTPVDLWQNLLMGHAKIKYSFCQNLRPQGKLCMLEVNLGLTI